MSNYVQNKLKVIGSDKEINEFFDAIKSVGKTPEDTRTIDFNKIVSSPAFANSDEQISWCYKNWGTKWNSYDNYDKRDSYDTIYFKTAWSSVLKLIKLLSVSFPNLELEYSFFNEDFGANVGSYKFKNGEILHLSSPEHFTKEAYDMALDIAKAKPEDFRLVFNEKQDNYTYYEV